MCVTPNRSFPPCGVLVVRPNYSTSPHGGRGHCEHLHGFCGCREHVRTTAPGHCGGFHGRIPVWDPLLMLKVAQAWNTLGGVVRREGAPTHFVIRPTSIADNLLRPPKCSGAEELGLSISQPGTVLRVCPVHGHCVDRNGLPGAALCPHMDHATALGRPMDAPWLPKSSPSFRPIWWGMEPYTALRTLCTANMAHSRRCRLHIPQNALCTAHPNHCHAAHCALCRALYTLHTVHSANRSRYTPQCAC